MNTQIAYQTEFNPTTGKAVLHTAIHAGSPSAVRSRIEYSEEDLDMRMTAAQKMDTVLTDKELKAVVYPFVLCAQYFPALKTKYGI